MQREPAITFAFSLLLPTLVFFVVCWISGAPRLITTFLTGILVVGLAVGAIFAAVSMRERQGTRGR